MRPRYLIDTCVLIWMEAGDRSRLGHEAERVLRGEADLLLSGASIWEMCIKVS